MTSFFDKLNMRPAERRVLVAVMLALFIVVNMVWIWPRFGDWQKAQKRFGEIESQMVKYNRLIKEKEIIQRKLDAEFETDSQLVPAEDQVTTFSRTYMSQALSSGVNIPGTARTAVRTNENFVEHTQTIPVSGDESALVNFIYNLGVGNSAVPIRVRELSLHPIEPQRQKLQGSVTIVASFQRKLNLRAPVPAAKTVAATATNAPAAITNRPPAALTNKPAAISTNKAPPRPSPTTIVLTNKPPIQLKQ